MGREDSCRADAGRDGIVTRAEVDRYVRSIEQAGFLARFDLNDDGKVTRE